jgi:hypothetical protein
MSIEPKLQQTLAQMQRDAWQTPRLEILPVSESAQNGSLGIPVNDGVDPCSS